jgi:hypothetical protein
MDLVSILNTALAPSAQSLPATAGAGQVRQTGAGHHKRKREASDSAEQAVPHPSRRGAESARLQEDAAQMLTLLHTQCPPQDMPFPGDLFQVPDRPCAAVEHLENIATWFDPDEKTGNEARTPSAQPRGLSRICFWLHG